MKYFRACFVREKSLGRRDVVRCGQEEAVTAVMGALIRPVASFLRVEGVC